jgi:hypothetical protein
VSIATALVLAATGAELASPHWMIGSGLNRPRIGHHSIHAVIGSCLLISVKQQTEGPGFRPRFQ